MKSVNARNLLGLAYCFSMAVIGFWVLMAAPNWLVEAGPALFMLVNFMASALVIFAVMLFLLVLIGMISGKTPAEKAPESSPVA